MSETRILLERDNVNDERVVLVRWHTAHGARVEKDTLLAEIETSKANVEVYAPATGNLCWSYCEKQEVPVTEAIGSIHDEAVTTPQPEPVKSAAGAGERGAVTARAVKEFGADAAQLPQMAGGRQRFSPVARKMMEEHGLTAAAFAGRVLVRKEDVLALLEPQAAAERAAQRAASRAGAVGKMAASLPRTAITQAYTEVALSKLQRAMGRNLAAGMANAVASAVSVTCDVDAGKQFALRLLFEVSRLLRKYPSFNATHRDGAMLQYADVNIGFAMDDGRGLKVAVLHQSDTLSLDEMGSKLRDLTMAYMVDKLTPAMMANPTFTVTDLSGVGAASFFPLISENQGAILGIGGEASAFGKEFKRYALTLTFDHQLSDGRKAALFLGELKKKLTA